MSFTDSALVVSWVLIAVLGLALAGVLARLHRLEEVVASSLGPTAGTGGPLPDLDPARVERLADGATLALFVDDGCGACRTAADHLGPLVAEGHARVLWRHEAPDDFDALGLATTPWAVVIDREGRIRWSAPVGSTERLDAAVSAATDAVRPTARPTPSEEPG